MDCKRIKALLMTDYIDGEVSQAIRAEIQAHLGSCAACKRLEEMVRARVAGLFKGVKPAPVPPELWQQIQARIVEEKIAVRPSFLSGLAGVFHGSLAMKRQVLGTITAVTFLLIALLLIQAPLRRARISKDYLRQQSEYMLSLHVPVNGDLEQDVRFNSAIEKYLL